MMFLGALATAEKGFIYDSGGPAVRRPGCYWSTAQPVRPRQRPAGGLPLDWSAWSQPGELDRWRRARLSVAPDRTDVGAAGHGPATPQAQTVASIPHSQRRRAAIRSSGGTDSRRDKREEDDSP